MAFVISVGETGVAINRTLRNGDGSIPDISTGSVTFSMEEFFTGAVKIDAGVCVINDVPTADVSYPFTAADVDTAGHYLGQFTHIAGDGKVRRFPVTFSGSEAYEDIEVVAAVNP